MALSKEQRRKRIKYRIRKKVSGTAERPRLSVFRSNKQITAQLINDDEGKTIVLASSLEKGVVGEKGNKVEIAEKVGTLISEKAQAAGITQAVFDRNGYLYHGRVKALAEAVRKAGLKL